MAPQFVDDIRSASTEHQSALKRGISHAILLTLGPDSFSTGRYTDTVDLLLSPPSAISKKTKLPLAAVQKIVDQLHRECTLRPVSLAELELFAERFTTGDAVLDDLLGGGIRPGMLWEIVGER